MFNSVFVMAGLITFNTQVGVIDFDVNALKECLHSVEGYCMVLGADNTGCLERLVRECEEEHPVVVSEIDEE